jgi:hypothetical protein
MMGLESTIVGTGLMSETQYQRARNTVISMMHDILDMKSDVVVVSSSDDSSDDEQVPHRENANHSRANDEFIAFEKLKRKKYLPVLAKPEHGGLVGEYNGKVKELWVGKVVEKGKNLPSKKNLADYIDERGRIQLIALFRDHRKSFPTLWLLVQKEASRRVTEVGCERFFALAGYVSAPRRTRLGVRNYERLAMLSSIVQSLYIDPDWVAAEYLRRCKKGCWIRRTLMLRLSNVGIWRGFLMLHNQPVPDDLTMDDFIDEEDVEE